MKDSILFHGKPASGKQTLANSIVEQYPQVAHVSSGEALRNVSLDTFTSEQRTEILAARNHDKYTSKETFFRVAEQYTKNLSESVILADGFPRTLEQVEWYMNKFNPLALLHLSVPDEVAMSRMINRGDRPITRQKAAERLSMYDKNWHPVYEFFRDETTIPTYSIRNTGSPQQAMNKVRTILDHHLL